MELSLDPDLKQSEKERTINEYKNNKTTNI